jgi:hypothetical protein
LAHAGELRRRLEAVYPIAASRALDVELTWTGAPPTDYNRLDRVNLGLERWRLSEALPAPQPLYYGFMRGNLGGGLADNIPGAVCCGWMPTDEFIYGRNRHAHELAHILGREHAVDSTLGLDADGYKQGYCSELAGTNVLDFPFFHDLFGGKKCTLGPMDQGPVPMVWGLDTNLERRYAPVVINPTNTYELMGYCTSPAIKWRWPSIHTYTNLFHLLTNRFPAPAAAGAMQPFHAAAAADYLVFSGEINLGENAASLDPVMATRLLQSPPPVPAGDYLLRLRSGGGAILNDIPFTPRSGEADAPEIGERTVVTFAIPVPADPAIRQVEILRGGQVIGARQASANAPSVMVLSPNGGESIANDPVTLRWDGDDADGDALTYTVQYSADGGQTWETLAVDWAQETLTLPRSALRGTEQGLIRVRASDGFNTAMDDSDNPFTVANHAPDLAVLSPSDNELAVGDQQLVLQADLADSEDGSLSGSQARWVSSLDGLLGNGPSLALNAGILSEGDHLITITGTDSAGASTSRTFRLRVRREVSPSLEIERVGELVRVAWPAGLADFVLEWSESLLPQGWAPVPQAPEIIGGLKRVSMPAASTRGFFRLRKP